MRQTEQFCQEISAKISTRHPKAFTNLVISMSSYSAASSVTELSESPLFHHQYSSIRDAIAGVGQDEAEQSAAMSRIRDLELSQLALQSEDQILLQTDASNIVKAHSTCLADRQYVKINNNVIASNKPISVGYPISLVNASVGVDKWSVPLDIRRIGSDQSATDCAVEQVRELVEQEQLCTCLVINTLDTSYGNASYMDRVYDKENLVNLIRFRYGNKVWLSYACPRSSTFQELEQKRKGRTPVFGDKFYLIDHSDVKAYHRKGVVHEVERTSIFDLPHQDYVELTGSTHKGRALNIQIWQWNDLLIRNKNGHQMQDKPFDLVASRVSDAQTGQLVFQRTMFTLIHGQQKEEISTQQAFEGYRKRYDIEPSIKFAKRELLLDKYQTPCKQHFDNWLVVVMTAFWLLFAAKDEVNYIPTP
ncbi:MAG: transposase [Bacteroidota bacterium]